MSSDGSELLVHLGAGVGNIVLATPLLVALHELNFTVDVLLDADYPQSADLLRPWCVVRKVLHRQNCDRMGSRAYSRVVPAMPPFYRHRFSHGFGQSGQTVPRPPEPSFYQNEQEFYLSFARALGFPADRSPLYRLPIGPDDASAAPAHSLVLAPGCKTGEMMAKRWPYFVQLAEQFENVGVVGTVDDLRQPDGTFLSFPPHVRSYVGKLTLRQTAELMAAAGAVVGNDSGLSHVAGAVGTPTLMLFGPTPDRTLGRLPPNVQVLRRGVPCEPCWFHARLRACARRMDCLRDLSVQAVADAVRGMAPA
jgi:ADP-heptose:LPS heptosyltransferase